MKRARFTEERIIAVLKEREAGTKMADAHVCAGLLYRHRGVRVDRAVALQILEAVSDRAVEAAIMASDQVERSRQEIIAAGTGA